MVMLFTGYMILKSMIDTERTSRSPRSIEARARRASAEMIYWVELAYIYANVFVTKLFCAAGMKNIMRFAPVYRVPLSAVYPYGHRSCHLTLSISMPVSDRADLKRPETVLTDKLFKSVVRFLTAIGRASPSNTIRRSRKKFLLPWKAFQEFLNVIYPIVFSS